MPGFKLGCEHTLRKVYIFLNVCKQMSEERRDQDNDIQIFDTENFQEDKTTFNHQALVMNRLASALESGSHELRPGWIDEKMDRNGNIKRTPIEDTRLKFIESVKSCMNVMRCDYDEEAVDTIDGYEDQLMEIKEKLLKEQWDWYMELPDSKKRELQVSRMAFRNDLIWYAQYIENSIECFRAILTELNLLTKRLRFYQEDPQDFIA